MTDELPKYPIPPNPDEYVPGEDEGLEFENDRKYAQSVEGTSDLPG